MNYYLIPKISIPYALMVGRFVMWERNKNLYYGKVLRITNTKNLVVDVDGKEVFARNKSVRYGVWAIVSDKDLDAYGNDGHGKRPTIDMRHCIWSSNPEWQYIDVLMYIFPNTWNEAKDKFEFIVSIDFGRTIELDT